MIITFSPILLPLEAIILSNTRRVSHRPELLYLLLKIVLKKIKFLEEPLCVTDVWFSTCRALLIGQL